MLTLVTQEPSKWTRGQRLAAELLYKWLQKFFLLKVTITRSTFGLWELCFSPCWLLCTFSMPSRWNSLSKELPVVTGNGQKISILVFRVLNFCSKLSSSILKTAWVGNKFVTTPTYRYRLLTQFHLIFFTEMSLAPTAKKASLSTQETPQSLRNCTLKPLHAWWSKVKRNLKVSWTVSWTDIHQRSKTKCNF